MPFASLPSPLPSSAIGGKARGLSDLMSRGWPVPPAFVVLPGDRLDERDLAAALATLGPGPWAVRSSGVSEDSAAASFAGVHDTVLGVVDLPGVLSAICACRDSATSARAQAYRAERHLPTEGLAVIVQRQLAPDVAGVAFSLDPVSGRADTVVVEAVRGLGESLVSGRAVPARALFARTLELRALTQPSPHDEVLSEPIAREVARLTLEVEAAMAVPVDVEWAWAEGRAFLLQWRPVTASGALDVAASSPRQLWSNTNTAEVLPDVARSAVFDVLQGWLASLFGPLSLPFGIDMAKVPMIGLVAGRVYFSVNHLVGWMRAFPGFGGRDLRSFADMMGGDKAAYVAHLAQLQPGDIPQHHVPWWRALWGMVTVGMAMLRAQSGRADDAIAELAERTRRDQAVDVAALDDAGLLRFLSQMLDAPFGDTHDARGIAAASIGMVMPGVLIKLTRRWLHDASGELARRLLSATGALDSAEAGLALWRLGRLARELGLTHALTGEWSEVRAVLTSSPAGARFIAAFEGFLHLHGHHARGECDVSVPRWSEQPTYVLSLVRAAADVTGDSTAGREASRSEERDALLADVLRRVGPLRGFVLRQVIRRATAGQASRENLKSEAVRRLAVTRVVLLEVGRRLVARGLLGEPDDVFFLSRGEWPRALAGTDFRAEVRARKQRHVRFEACRPPAVVHGAWSLEDFIPRVQGGTELTGLAASPGVVEGPARVILRADTQETLREGEILVAPFTDPGWTPYFVTAAGIVMDFGGVLSHGAIVAREYGLPAVVNVTGATQRITTGARLRVDGTRGIVTLLPAPPAPAPSGSSAAPSTAPPTAGSR